jgi:hypothetical protein
MTWPWLRRHLAMASGPGVACPFVMPTLTTVDPARWRDRWSFSGHGRKRYAHTTKPLENPTVELDRCKPSEEEPTGPGEPKG